MSAFAIAGLVIEAVVVARWAYSGELLSDSLRRSAIKLSENAFADRQRWRPIVFGRRFPLCWRQ